MARYDQIFAILAERAVLQGGISVDAFVQRARAAGMADDAIQRELLADLDEGGPIFGGFLRSLTSASESAVMSATRQGEAIGAIDGDAELRRLTALAGADDALALAMQSADPEAADLVQQAVVEVREITWVCALRNTCERCLPLHGQSRTEAEWQQLGLHPDTIHPSDWRSSCHCRLVDTPQAEGRADLVAPLKRNALQGARSKGSKKTARAVTQNDLDKALAARDAAMQSTVGRRTLRLLGRTNQDQPEE